LPNGFSPSTESTLSFTTSPTNPPAPSNGNDLIEGADFTDQELDEALKTSPEELITRSQKQAAAKTYLWIASLPDDYPVNESLIREIHANIIRGADDDHCPLKKNPETG